MTAFALLADELKWWSLQQQGIDQAKKFDEALDGLRDFNQRVKRGEMSTDIGAQEAAIGASRGATGLAAINWVLFSITLVAFGIFLHKHRVANGSGGSGFSLPRKTGDVETAGNQEKTVHNQPVELRDVQHQYPQYPQQPAATH